jgi:hypothetical protein
MNLAQEPSPTRVWFHPSKLWQATEKMSKAEADAFLENVYALAERRDFAALQHFDFIRVGRYSDIRWS